jgi:two-component system chemotaxis sensor kinase CheA
VTTLSDDMDMRAYRDVFLSESAEYIQAIIEGMLALEADTHDLEPVEVVFRGAHSLKGMAAAMGYERTSELTHKMESLMDTVRKREQAVDGALVDLMLRAVDVAKALIDDESNGRAAVDASAITAEIEERTRQTTGSAAAGQRPDGEGSAHGAVSLEPGERIVHASVDLEEECVLKSVRAYMVMKRLNHMGQVVETVPSAREIEDELFGTTFEVYVRTRSTPQDVERAVLGVTEVHAVRVEEVEGAPAGEGPADVGATGEPRPRARTVVPKLSESQTVRISIAHLDTLVDLVGELVILRARLETLASECEDLRMNEAVERLHAISADLQHEVMQTRMVPVGNIFNRFPRMVRDLARDLGKDVAFEMDGLDIELDRTVLDEIGDPLVHLLRNAIDHGVEPAPARIAAGKPPRGLVRLTAARERDQVLISVSDDGAGMDLDRIWRKAVERGMCVEGERDQYSPEDLLMLTCTPGFSTTEQATKVSGRGVGMDVVRGKIEYLGGSLHIRPQAGGGTEFELSLPLTLAIIQALLVSTNGQTFALPLGAVTEVFAPDEIDADTVDAMPVVTLRDGRVVALHRLDVLLGFCDDATRLPGPHEHIVLVEMGDTARALAVESLEGRQEIVIKPLSRMFRGVRGLGGATVLGDGSVALILDPRMMFSMGGDR